MTGELEGPAPQIPMPPEPGTFLIETYDDVSSVTVFNDRIIVITKSGSVMVIDRYNGQLRTA